jgi:hypothetical protein
MEKLLSEDDILKKFDQITKDYDVTCEIFGESGSLGQSHVDSAYSKILQFVFVYAPLYPKFKLNIPTKIKCINVDVRKVSDMVFKSHDNSCPMSTLDKLETRVNTSETGPLEMNVTDVMDIMRLSDNMFEASHQLDALSKESENYFNMFWDFDDITGDQYQIGDFY